MTPMLVTLREYLPNGDLDRKQEIDKIVGWLPEAIRLIKTHNLPINLRLVLGYDTTTQATLEEMMVPEEVQRELFQNNVGPITGFYKAIFDSHPKDPLIRMYLDAGQFDVSKLVTLEAIAFLGETMLGKNLLYGNLSRTKIRLARNQDPSETRELDELILALLIRRDDDMVLNPNKLTATSKESKLYQENRVVESTPGAVAINWTHPKSQEFKNRIVSDNESGVLTHFAYEYHLVTLASEFSPRATILFENEDNYFKPTSVESEEARATAFIMEKEKSVHTSVGPLLRRRFAERKNAIKTLLCKYYDVAKVDEVMGIYSSFLQ